LSEKEENENKKRKEKKRKEKTKKRKALETRIHHTHTHTQTHARALVAMRKCSRFDFVSPRDVEREDDEEEEEEQEQEEGNKEEEEAMVHMMMKSLRRRREKTSLLDCLIEMNESGRQLIGHFWENPEMREAFSIWWNELSTEQERAQLVRAAKLSSIDSLEETSEESSTITSAATEKSETQRKSSNTKQHHLFSLFEENDEFAMTLCALQRIVAPELTRPKRSNGVELLRALDDAKKSPDEELDVFSLLSLLSSRKENFVFATPSTSSILTLREVIAAAVRQELELIGSLSSDILRSRKHVRLLVSEAFDSLAMKLSNDTSNEDEELERLSLLPLLMEMRRVALRNLKSAHTSSSSLCPDDNKEEEDLLTLDGLKAVRTHVFTRFFGALIAEFLGFIDVSGQPYDDDLTMRSVDADET